MWSWCISLESGRIDGAGEVQDTFIADFGLSAPAHKQETAVQTGESANGFDELWDYNQPGESEARFRQALAEQAPGSPLYVEILTQIARAQGLQRNFDAAHQTLDEAQRLLHTDAAGSPETTRRPRRSINQYALESCFLAG
jgi:hypothetical protein